MAELLSGGAALDETVADLLDVDILEIDRLMAEHQRHDLNLHAGDVTPSGSSAKSDVLAYIVGRGEDEIVVRPENVKRRWLAPG